MEGEIEEVTGSHSVCNEVKARGGKGSQSTFTHRKKSVCDVLHQRHKAQSLHKEYGMWRGKKASDVRCSRERKKKNAVSFVMKEKEAREAHQKREKPEASNLRPRPAARKGRGPASSILFRELK